MRITFFSQVNATDDRVHIVLHWAAVSDNGKAVDLLFDAGIDHSIEAFPVCTALQIATQTFNQCLHFSFIVGGYSSKVMILLLEPKADIDKPYAVISMIIAWSILFKVNTGGFLLSMGILNDLLSQNPTP